MTSLNGGIQGAQADSNSWRIQAAEGLSDQERRSLTGSAHEPHLHGGNNNTSHMDSNASGRLTDFLIYYFFNGMKIHKAQKKSIQFVFCLKNEINTPVKGFDATADQTGGAETNQGGLRY